MSRGRRGRARSWRWPLAAAATAATAAVGARARRLPPGYQRRPLPPTRKLTIDAARAGRRANPVHGLLEVDVTAVRERLRTSRSPAGRPLSFTAYVVATVARTAARHPAAHAFQDWRGRIVTSDHVHVAALVEATVGGTTTPLVQVLRDAERRTVGELTDELHSAKEDPSSGGFGHLLPALRAFLALPGPVRVGTFRALARSPRLREAMTGTVVVSAVGMFGRDGGWGIPFPTVYTLGVLVGGIGRLPRYLPGGDEPAPRDVLDLTITFDHDVVDGAPAARFARDLTAMLASGAVLGADGAPRGTTAVSGDPLDESQPPPGGDSGG